MRFLLTLFTLLLLIAVTAGAGLIFLKRHLDTQGPLTTQTTVFIAPGTGVKAMGAQLSDAHVIQFKEIFYGVVALRQIQGRLQAGEYAFEPGVSLGAVINKMVSGDVLHRMVTIPEGLSSFEATQIINAAEGLRGTVEVPADGTLLPETYSYIRDEPRSKLVGQMQSAMTQTIDQLWESRAQNLPFKTKEEALVLASIVEKETRVPSERARVAGVYINRLNKGMMLQSDPTVIYAITKGTAKIDRVLYAHLETDSPYNTYRNTGLPPGPICNPGKASIAAVLQPETNDYLYFVADGTGAHIFAKTADEHLANVAKWRVVQRAARTQNASGTAQP